MWTRRPFGTSRKCLVTLIAVLVLPGVLKTIGANQNGGCQKGKLTKEDIIPGLKSYILQQLGMDEETANSLNVNETVLDQEQLEENRLITRIEDRLEPYHPTKQRAKSVKSYTAHYVKKSNRTRVFASGLATQSQQYKLKFQVPSKQAKVSKIQLVLYQRPLQKNSSDESPSTYTVEVSYKTSVRGQGIVVPLATTRIELSKSGYSVIDITADKGQWLKGLKGKPIVIVVMAYIEGRKETFAQREEDSYQFVSETDNPSQTPRLIIMSDLFTEEPTKLRRKRQTTPEPKTELPVERCSDTNNNCCRKELIVNFQKDLKLDTLIEPAELDIGYCSGSCIGLREPSHKNYYDFLNYTDQRSIRPCCVPDVIRSVTVTAKFNKTSHSFQWAPMKIISCKCV